MENFVAYNPTKLHFGKGVINELPNVLKEYGSRVLFICGKGSIKKSGIYDKVIEQLHKANSSVFEYHGIKSNPIIDDVDEAAELGRKNDVDIVIGVGGGSVIDSSKIISAAIATGSKGWDIMTGKVSIDKMLPVIGVLTLAATGTEMNDVAVLQNHETEQKKGLHDPMLYPTHSFLDPEYTYSVPRDYTAYGVIDLITHCLEFYFGAGDCSLSDRFIEAIIKDAMEWGPKVIENPTNYEYRASIMWDATNALNGLTGYGKVSGDGAVHGIGHTLSLLYDVPHGASLSIAYPAWLKLQKDRIPERIKKLGVQLFNSESIEDTIRKIENLFELLEGPIRLSQCNIGGDDMLNEIKRVLVKNKISGKNCKLKEEDYDVLIEYMK
jgi:alcohol dehydrogenase YqhD (iron-dependent ADH family)